MKVREVMTHKAVFCGPDCALKTLRGARIRRLWAIDRDGTLISYADVENAYQAIRGRPIACQPRPMVSV